MFCYWIIEFFVFDFCIMFVIGIWVLVVVMCNVVKNMDNLEIKKEIIVVVIFGVGLND